jgi:regulator of replication initiation timing
MKFKLSFINANSATNPNKGKGLFKIRNVKTTVEKPKKVRNNHHPKDRLTTDENKKLREENKRLKARIEELETEIANKDSSSDQTSGTYSSKIIKLSKVPEEVLSFDPDTLNLGDEARAWISKFMNIIEQLVPVLQSMKDEIQALRDEVNRLKGEKGKPKIKPSIPAKENDIPNPVKKPKAWKKKSKKKDIKIDRTEICCVNPATLPPDAEFKGYRTVTVQNVKIITDNVCYIIECYYSPSEKKTYEGSLPGHVDGEFGPDLKAHTVNFYFSSRVPEKKILKMWTDVGISISDGQISNILTKTKQEEFTKEKKDIFKTGINVTTYFHADDTGARHKGVNHYVTVICTLLFSVFFINPKKNRATIKEILGLDEDEIIQKVLVSDDARQFWFIAFCQMLCWIHEIRHYKKLRPSFHYNRKRLHDFISELWVFYNLLDEYRNNPSDDQKVFLSDRFDTLFTTQTGYSELDKRIELTREKKDKLLAVLVHPEIPLHNNPAEIALREFVLKRKISHGTRSEAGRIAWENMMSILDTCRKLGVNFIDYVRDIYSGEYQMSRLADLILERASEMMSSE